MIQMPADNYYLIFKNWILAFHFGQQVIAQPFWMIFCPVFNGKNFASRKRPRLKTFSYGCLRSLVSLAAASKDIIDNSAADMAIEKTFEVIIIRINYWPIVI